MKISNMNIRYKGFKYDIDKNYAQDLMIEYTDDEKQIIYTVTLLELIRIHKEKQK